MTHRIHNLGQRARRLSLAALLALTILAGGGAAMAAHALQANAPAAIYPWRPGMYAAPAATQAAPSDDGSPSAPQKPRLSDGVTKLRSIVPTQPWRYPLGLSVCCR